MNRTLRGLAAAIGAAALTVAALAASPVSSTTTVSVLPGNSIVVHGALGEDLAPVTIGLDALGDAVGSGLGMDVTEYAVSFPSLGKVAFHVTLGDANPATGYFPQGTVIEIAPTIGPESVELTATATLDGGLEFGAQSCAVNADTNVNECSTSPIEGSYAAGVVTFVYATSAPAGSTINGGHVHVNYHVGTGLSGGVTFVNGIIDEMGINALAVTPSVSLFVDGELAATQRLSNGGYVIGKSGYAAGVHAVSVELCGGDASPVGAPVGCTMVDLGTVTVSEDSRD